MKKYTIRILTLLSFGALAVSCGPKSSPPLVYFPDMYFPVAYDPLMKAQDPYSDHENQIPAFVARNGETGLAPVDGTVSQNQEGIVESNSSQPLTAEQYNAGYDESKKLAVSPLMNATDKDIERGKMLFNHTCAACHGEAGDGQGPIVKSGAYSGVPNYKDRELTVGSVHYVLTYGRNAMGSYAGQLKPADRWRVAMYVMNAFKQNAPAPEVAATGTTTTAPAATATDAAKTATTAAAPAQTTSTEKK